MKKKRKFIEKYLFDFDCYRDIVDGYDCILYYNSEGVEYMYHFDDDTYYDPITEEVFTLAGFVRHIKRLQELRVFS